ncbi:MAG: ATP-binding cassette domain-containing protein [Anaerolineales bacterium]|nr:ATP-binding cassette domain-containing protein [Anaerolineales bacterium]
MITLNQLRKTYSGGVTALRGIDLDIGAGMFGLVGPNGAGKTTLMRILAGVVRPTSGRVLVLGHDLATAAGKRAVKAQLGYLPQALGLYPDLNAVEFLDYVALLKGVADAAARRAQVEQVLALVRLSQVAGRRLKTYSGGMQRRVGIAQALLGEPRLLIVDEPTAGLDPEERVRLRNLLSEMAQRCTVILSTHIVEDISQSCNDLAVIGQGQVLFHGRPRDLIGQARGHVWAVTTTTGQPPADALSVVSSVQLESGTRYRVLGETLAAGAEPVEPTLEDGYMWLMQRLTAAPNLSPA